MRIIGGAFRGKQLLPPKDRSIRPTGDRVRESLFNILDHQGLVSDGRFLDLFCGTGAVGLEAFSRGAKSVWLMDQDIRLAAANLQRFGNPESVRLGDQSALARRQTPVKFDVVFLDPPYAKGLVEPALMQLRSGWLADGGWIVVELSAKEAFETPAGFFLRQERTYGRARLMFLGVDEDATS